MQYLRWVKELNGRLHGRRDVINLAGSAFHLPAATAWLEEQIVDQGQSLVAAEKVATNEFGLPELIEQIRSAYQIGSDREVLVTSGSTGSIRLAYQMLFAGGGPHHVVAEQPIYEPLLSMARRMGATVDLAPRGRGGEFIDEVARRLTPVTAAVVLTNPHNPTGDLLNAEPLRALADLVAARTREGVIVIDETFGDLSTLARWSMGNVDQRIITINGLTKSYGLGSLRCGWMSVDRGRFPEATNDWIEFENIGCPWTELLGARAVAQFDAWRPQVTTKLATARRTLAAWLEETAAEGLLSHEPVGESCVVFPRWQGKTSPLELAERLIAEHGVVVAPGEFFYPVEGAAIRIGYGGDPGALREGLQRLKQGLRAIG